MFPEVPQPPQNLTLKSTDDGRISLSWFSPKFDGGSQITNYLVQICPSGSGHGWTTYKKLTSDLEEVDITGLQEGNHYYVRVFAENEIGHSTRAAEIYEAICAKKPLSK